MANDNAGAQGHTDNAGNADAGKAAADATAAAAAKATADAAAAAAAAAAEPGKAGTDANAKAKADADAAAAKAAAVPDKYTLTVPKGSTIDESDMQAIEVIARENGWTNDEAQARLQQHHDFLVEQSTKFADVTKADKDYGGEKLAITKQRAKAVIDKVRPASHPRAQAFRALLDKSGYGNHIEVVSFLADLGKLTEEDSGAAGGSSGGGGGSKDAAEVLYGATGGAKP